MAARKTECSLEQSVGAAALPGKEVRSLEVVAEEMRKRLASGQDAEKIREELQISYHVMNEVLSQAYKLVGRAPEIFEYQERMRIGEIEA